MNRANPSATVVFIGLLCTVNCFSSDAAQPLADVPATTTPALSAKPDVVPDLLDRIRQANDELYTTLQSFVCAESIQRFKGRHNGDSAHRVDTVTAKVSFENGTEQYTDIRQNDSQRPSISSISGAWSVGEFGTLLRQTQTLLQTEPATFQTYADFEGSPAAVYSLAVSEQDSPWDLVVRSQHFRIPFRTDLWISTATGQVLRIQRTSTSVPSQMGISKIRWGVTLQPTQMNEKTWLLPKTGNYEVLYEGSDRKEWNLMTFSDYHRYGSEVALHFQ